MLSRLKSRKGAELAALLVADVFQLAGAFRRLGDGIAAKVGQTQARWQVLSVASGGPQTVAQMARRLGYARQSVQRTTDQLINDGLARYVKNPKHEKSALVEISGQGRRILVQITREAQEWHAELTAGIEPAELATALRVIRQLGSALEKGMGEMADD